ncbi:MAG: type II CAAX endopeptidase family protein [Acidobacteriota bacterium]
MNHDDDVWAPTEAPPVIPPGTPVLPPVPPEERPLDPLTALFMGVAYAGGLLVAFIVVNVAFYLMFPDSPRFVLLLSQVFGILVPSLVLIAAGRRSTLYPFRPPHWFSGRGVFACLLLAIGSVLGANSIGALWIAGLYRLAPGPTQQFSDFVEEQFALLLIADTPINALLTLALVTITPAICEEVAFRRCLQGYFLRGLPVAFSILLSSLIFSAFHLDPLGFWSRVFVGLALGYLYHRTGSLLLAGACHAIYNGIAVAPLLWEMRKGHDVSLMPDLSDVQVLPQLGMFALGIVVSLFAAWLIRRRSTT